MSSVIRPVGYLDELRRIVPTEQIEPQYDGEQGIGGSWAVEPAAQVELVEVLKWANARHAAVFTRRPRRGDAAACGRRPRIYLRGGRMKRISDLDIVSGTVTVQSGISMEALHRILAERSYTTGFPTRPWRHQSLGAVLAASLDAHWGPRYGSLEDQVVSLGVVFPDGSVAGSRSSPRKAVGPDFDRLFLGSRGRYGIIHRATIRIFPSSSRLVLSYGAESLTQAVEVVRDAFDQGLHPRAVEILTPAPDRAWGRRRVGLTDTHPVLVLVEPFGPLAGRSTSWVSSQFAGRLLPLEPPEGWSVHEGLLPPPRGWTAPVVGVRWAELHALCATLGDDVPSGLWIVRMSRHGCWLSIAAGIEGPSAETVRALVKSHRDPSERSAWSLIGDRLAEELDPKGILNPVVR